MKYEVEFRRTSFVTYTIEADSQERAEALAWKEIPDQDFKSADWVLESIEQVKE